MTTVDKLLQAVVKVTVISPGQKDELRELITNILNNETVNQPV